jgi:hypothetical protein
MPYSPEFKENFINEFLDRYQKDPDLSLRKFGIEKFGKAVSLIYLWLPKYDVNNIYIVNNGTRPIMKSSVIKPTIVKVTNNDNKLYPTSRANISIKFGDASIDMGSSYSKEDLLLVLSALKEVNNVD